MMTLFINIRLLDLFEKEIVFPELGLVLLPVYRD